MKKRKARSVPRNQYRVTLVCEDGSKPQFTVWAEAPEHAIRKVMKEKYKSSLLVVSQSAERTK